MIKFVIGLFLNVSAIMEKIPDQLGFLVLTEDGAVLESGGELENDERVATIVTDLISLSNRFVKLIKIHKILMRFSILLVYLVCN